MSKPREDEHLFSPKRLFNAVRLYCFFIVEDDYYPFWTCLKYYRRRVGDIRKETPMYWNPQLLALLIFFVAILVSLAVYVIITGRRGNKKPPLTPRG
jgi:hypothetical protein